jgi:gentisate 1,2-dioxygenase
LDRNGVHHIKNNSSGDLKPSHKHKQLAIRGLFRGQGISLSNEHKKSFSSNASIFFLVGPNDREVSALAIRTADNLDLPSIAMFRIKT